MLMLASATDLKSRIEKLVPFALGIHVEERKDLVIVSIRVDALTKIIKGKQLLKNVKTEIDRRFILLNSTIEIKVI